MKRKLMALCLIGGLLSAGLQAGAADPAVGPNAAPNAAPKPKPAPKPEVGVSLTVYNHNLGVVKERRPIEFKKGVGEIRFEDVAKRIDPTSVHFKSLDRPNDVSILEQNYEYDLVNANKLLDKFLDKPITVFLKDGKKYAGTLMSFDHAQIVLKDKEGALTMIARNDNVKDIQFSKLPEGLIVKPSLMWKVSSKKGGKQLCQITYMTSGIGWKADYTAVVNAADTQLDLGGWVTITNNSGATYKNAKLKLIAGDIHRSQPPRPAPGQWARAEMMDKRGGGFQEKSFFEYHLYTLPRPATVKENQVKQIELLSADKVPITKRYYYDHQVKAKKVMVKLEFANSKKNNVGMALPLGRVRIYKRDTDGSLELLGEDNIDHTPKDEEVKLYVGDAFDLIPEFTQTGFRQLGEKTTEQTFSIKLRNHKEKGDVEIIVVAHPGANVNWEIRNNSHEFTKKDAGTIEFKVPVKKDAEAELKYTIRRWR